MNICLLELNKGHKLANLGLGLLANQNHSSTTINLCCAINKYINHLFL